MARFSEIQRIHAEYAFKIRNAYMEGVNDALAVVNQLGMEEALKVLNRSWGSTTHPDGSTTEHPPTEGQKQSNLQGAAKHARHVAKTKADDEALVARITPLLEKHFRKAKP